VVSVSDDHVVYNRNVTCSGKSIALQLKLLSALMRNGVIRKKFRLQLRCAGLKMCNTRN